MNLNTLHDLFVSLIGYSTKWQTRTNLTETPSRRYVRKSKTRHMKSTNGRVAYTGNPSKIDDPKFRYFNAAESAKTGYLQNRMKIYMELVKNESNGTVCDGTEVGSNRKTVAGKVPSVVRNGLQSSKLNVVEGES